MNLLYIGTWGAEDPLSRSTILPHLKILSDLRIFNRIIYASLERISSNPIELNIPNLRDAPYFESNQNKYFRSYLLYYNYFNHLKRIIENEPIDLMICRGAQAGVLGFKIWKSTGIKFYVESFEPHAQYMTEAGTWSTFDPRFIIQKRYEQRQKSFASGLLPVSENYRRQLIHEGVPPDKLSVLPCTVDTDFFKPAKEPNLLRKKLHFTDNEIIGIYVGKFGDLYLDREAFDLFSTCFSFFSDNFKLVILTPDNQLRIIKKLEGSNIDLTKVTLDFLEPEQLRDYLSVADFAFCTVKPRPSSNYCCPVKNGEYWSMGLPVVIPKAIGDDSQLILKHRTGVVLDGLDNMHMEAALHELSKLLVETDCKHRIRQLAIKLRGRHLVKQVYQNLFD